MYSVFFFNILLTVHHAMILGNCPTWRTNCINTASGNCHSVLVEVSCAATNTESQLPEAVLIQFVSSDDEHDMLETCTEL